MPADNKGFVFLEKYGPLLGDVGVLRLLDVCKKVPERKPLNSRVLYLIWNISHVQTVLHKASGPFTDSTLILYF